MTDDTDRLNEGNRSLTSRRGYMKMAFGGLVGSQLLTSQAVETVAATSNTIDLGDRGLSNGDLIDEYLADHLQSGNEVRVPAGEYEWRGDRIGGSYNNAALVGDGDVTFNFSGEYWNTSIFAVDGGDFAIQNVTIRGAIESGTTRAGSDSTPVTRRRPSRSTTSTSPMATSDRAARSGSTSAWNTRGRFTSTTATSKGSRTTACTRVRTENPVAAVGECSSRIPSSRTTTSTRSGSAATATPSATASSSRKRFRHTTTAQRAAAASGSGIPETTSPSRTSTSRVTRVPRSWCRTVRRDRAGRSTTCTSRTTRGRRQPTSRRLVYRRHHPRHRKREHERHRFRFGLERGERVRRRIAGHLPCPNSTVVPTRRRSTATLRTRRGNESSEDDTSSLEHTITVDGSTSTEKQYYFEVSGEVRADSGINPDDTINQGSVDGTMYGGATATSSPASSSTSRATPSTT